MDCGAVRRVRKLRTVELTFAENRLLVREGEKAVFAMVGTNA